MTFEQQQAEILNKMEQELLYPELVEEIVNGVTNYKCVFKDKNGTIRTTVTFRNQEEANEYMPRYIEEHLANNTILEKRAKCRIAQLYLESTDWVEPYIIKHLSGLETLASTSNKLVIDANRTAAKAFIKSNVETVPTAPGLEAPVCTLCFLATEPVVPVEETIVPTV